MKNQDFFRDWRGPVIVSEALCRNGFQIHKLYKNIIASFCKNSDDHCELDEYFLEVTREYVSSGRFDGNKIDRGAFRDQDNYYNSDLLDRLEGLRGGSSSRHGILHNGLNKFFKEFDINEKFRKKILDDILKRFIKEMENHRKIAKFVYKSSPRDLFKCLCINFGLKEFKTFSEFRGDPSRVFGIKAEHGLVIYTFLDAITEGNGQRAGFFNAPVSIGRDSVNLRKDISLGDMQFIIPGIDRYCNNIPEGGLNLAFSAYLTCFVEFFDTISELRLG